MAIRTLFGFLLLAACPVFAADQDFNGRWDITAMTQRPRASWLELTGVGTSTPSGKFVSAYAGDMNKIDSIGVKDGELQFSFNIPNRKEPSPVYRARLVNGKLEGTIATEGQTSPPTKWTGVRSPVIAEKDEGTW